jgi:hypothetical protein
MNADATPAAGGLTEAERAVIDDMLRQDVLADDESVVYVAVERIIAARTEAADREAARVTAAVEAVLDPLGDPTDPTHLHPQAASIIVQVRGALSSADTTALDRVVAEAEQRGREDNAEHDMCYVSGSKALDDTLDRERAKARAEGVRLAGLYEFGWWCGKCDIANPDDGCCELPERFRAGARIPEGNPDE